MFKTLFKSTEKQVEEIHNEFNTAPERLYEEAKAFLASLKIIPETMVEDKAEALKNLGFVQAEDVKLATKLKTERDKAKNDRAYKTKEADIILDYKRRYPFLKFLIESELDRICDKYNLIYAPVHSYIKTVPDKNLKEIQNAAPLLNADKEGKIYFVKATSDRFNADVPEYIKEAIKKEGACFYAETRRVKYHGGGYSHETYLVYDRNTDYNIDQIFYNRPYLSEIKRNGLFIAAPKSHFDLSGLKKTKKRGFHKVIEIKDPIVFRYVRGGIQVLTMWGDENFDPNLEPALHNEINN